MTNILTAIHLQKELKKYSSTKRKETNEWFFKTGKGQYGEGDKFLGVSSPDIRKVAKKFISLNDRELKKVIHSQIHEERFCALVILVKKYKKANSLEKKRILDFYLQNKQWVNNWDLVDVSASKILGKAIFEKLIDKSILEKLVNSKSLWDRRISIVATFYFIKNKNIKMTLQLSKKLLSDKEDLIHKATGWMLREARKRDAKRVDDFLIKNYQHIPRTTLRYAIERMEEKKRKKFLKGQF